MLACSENTVNENLKNQEKHLSWLSVKRWSWLTKYLPTGTDCVDLKLIVWRTGHMALKLVINKIQITLICCFYYFYSALLIFYFKSELHVFSLDKLRSKEEYVWFASCTSMVDGGCVSNLFTFHSYASKGKRTCSLKKWAQMYPTEEQPPHKWLFSKYTYETLKMNAD